MNGKPTRDTMCNEYQVVRENNGCERCYRFVQAINFDWHNDMATMRALRVHWMQAHWSDGRVEPFVTNKTTFGQRLWYRLCKCTTEGGRPRACQAYNRLGTYFCVISEAYDRLAFDCFLRAAEQLTVACPIALRTVAGFYEEEPVGVRESHWHYLYQSALGGNPVAMYVYAHYTGQDRWLHRAANTPLYFGAGAPPQWQHGIAGVGQGFAEANLALFYRHAPEPGGNLFTYRASMYLRAAAQQGNVTAQRRLARSSIRSSPTSLFLPNMAYYLALCQDQTQMSRFLALSSGTFQKTMQRLLMQAVWITRILRNSPSAPFSAAHRTIMSLETFALCLLPRVCAYTCEDVPQVRLVPPVGALFKASQIATTMPIPVNPDMILDTCLPNVNDLSHKFFQSSIQ